MTASQYIDDARRRTTGLASRVGAAAARRLLNRNTVSTGLALGPKNSGLQSIPGDKGLPILGHTLTAAALGNEFMERRLELEQRLSASAKGICHRLERPPLDVAIQK